MAIKKDSSSPPRFTFDPTVHGSGGFARVIKGRDNELERDVAVKVLTPLATQFGESDRERFRREARILASLSYPNIPAIFDVQFTDNEFAIIFEFVDGETLAALIDREGPQDLSDVRKWLTQVAGALDHAHVRGVVHRDIKPSNIIITPDRQSAYVVDFGIALTADDASKLTPSGHVIGTPGYMSPEQIAGDELDSRSDLYSLGVTLFEALAGKKIAQGQYEELSALNETIPPQIDALVLECLAPVEQRVHSAKEFETRLMGALTPQKPLSEVLATGRLHEIALAIGELSSEEFAGLPAGQRALVLAKMEDIVASESVELRAASESFLSLLTTRGLRIDADEYRDIISPAIRWSFEHSDPEYTFVGSPSIRRSIVEAARQARAQAHDVLSEEIANFFEVLDLSSVDAWQLNGARDILEALLSNPACGDAASRLGTLLRSVNAAHRAQRRLLTGVASE